MDDLISRQAAIDICTNAIDLWHGQLGEGALVAVQGRIKALPPVQSEPKSYRMGYQAGYAAAQRWIPCSERLPEENGQYLITVKYKHVDSYEDIYAEHGEWIDGRWDMFSFGHCGEVEDIIAWMPLPAPYSPEGEEHGET